MGVRDRLLVLAVLAVGAAAAAAQSGLASAALSRIGGVMLPARAAVHPTLVDDTAREGADPAWPALSGGIPVPASGSAGGAAGSPAGARPSLAGDPPAWMPGIPAGLANGPVPVLGPAPQADLGRLGLLLGQGGTAGCGFLAPGCAWLDCGLLNPACGLGFPVSVGGCDFPLSGCGLDGFDGCGCWRHRDVLDFDHRLHLRFRDEVRHWSWRWHRR